MTTIDLKRQSVPAASFDVVLCLDVLEHIQRVIGERRLRMRPASRALAAQTRARLRVRLTRRGVQVLRRSLQRGRRASVLLRLRAIDGAGNRSGLVRRTVRVVRTR